MLKYIGKRIIKLILTILAATVVIFSIIYFAPGDSAACLLAKPVIYLYPEEDTAVSVNIEGVELGTTYPEYNNGWKVIAHSDGSLVNVADNHEYSYLFWEGTSKLDADFSDGFCVKGDETASFLQDMLKSIGLEPKEYNEFIVYWLPLMENNNYNLISFQKSNYSNTSKLNINPKPDSLLRVFMAWKALETPVTIEPQKFESFERKGFTVIEWGGAEFTE